MTFKHLLGRFCVTLGLALFVLAAGCGGPGADGAGDDHGEHADEHADHGEHDHADHDHDVHEADEHPEHGKNGGHIVTFDCGDYTAEWVEQQAGGAQSVLVIMLGPDKENEVAIPADTPMTITTTVEGEEPQTFQLTASGQSEGKASRFQSTDASIQTAIDVAHGAGGKIMLTAEIDGTKCQAELVPHKH